VTLVRRAVALGLTLMAACARPQSRPQPAVQPTLPELSSEQLAPPVFAVGGAPTLAPDTAREPHVVIDTHSRDEDVRPLLEFVARAGGYRLVYAPGLSRRVRVSLNDVPASVALTALLDLAGLTLEPITPSAKPPLNRPVVFYELPVNVDSLSADAIVKRFGVSQAVAEMLVKSRR
jgi:hypothetical protein